MKNSIAGFIILMSINVVAQKSFLVGRTTGPLPFLEYGLGDDRLGGAKMTFLDSNIVVKVVDSVKDDYKVQLSNLHYGWLAKTSFKEDNSVHLSSYYLTGSWKVYGDEKYDYVTVSLNE